MNMEISNEIKAKVFAQYLGFGLIIAREESNFVSINRSGRINRAEHNPDHCKLILRPLSEITDEDASGITNVYFCKEADADSGFEIKYGKEFLINYENRIEDVPVLVADYLRFRGYDLPHYLLNGKTLKECDLAIYEQTV